MKPLARPSVLLRNPLAAMLLFAAVYAPPPSAAQPRAPAASAVMKVDLVQDLHWATSHGAMTNWFYNYKWDDPEQQIRILKQCGYQNALLSLKVDPNRWALLPGYLAGMKKYGVRLMGIHVGNWVETVDQGLRLAQATDRRNVGTMLHLFHFQATHSKDLEATLRRDKPYLMVVIIQGTDKDQATNKVLGEGTFDVVPLVRTLREIDYQGPLVTMGFSQRGDIPAKLLRGRQAWEQIKRDAFQAHP